MFLLPGLALLAIFIPFADMLPFDTTVRAVFLPLQDVALFVGVNTYRLTIQDRAIFILESSNALTYTPQAVAALYVSIAFRSALDLFPYSYQQQ